ncbi:hypothetical protein Taro_048617 [Colocasia esculenta]|uniref:Thaumatin-like protein 1 n=1 Tax=Colocasia esculenta TaxID=4460 RepID=A0A843X8N3_COLES|nr:hypothetical protein [Colocasia esculenta]
MPVRLGRYDILLRPRSRDAHIARTHRLKLGYKAHRTTPPRRTLRLFLILFPGHPLRVPNSLTCLPRSPALFYTREEEWEGVRSATFTFSNNCEHTVWPGLLASAGSSPLASTGFQLDKGETKSMSAPNGWSGRFWGRTLCSADSSGKFSCATGDCGSGTMECSGRGATPPATLAEFTLNGSGGMDFYDASLVDGYNLPMLVVPQGGTGGGNSTCTTTGCLVDLNGLCPSELKVTSSGEGVACKSACEAFGKDEYCCSGAYSNPNTCQPTSYSQFFKNACPRAYSYAYDDGTSTFTCPGGISYLITFCPTTARYQLINR